VGSLEQYWSGIGAWMQIQAEAFNDLIEHQGEKGRANELSVASFLAGLLPSNLAIGSGVLVGINGQQSRQCDLVVHEVHKHPRLFAQTAQFIYPADTVAMTVEVKTTLDRDEVKAIGNNTASVRGAQQSTLSTYKPLVVVFAFSTSASPATTLKWFTALPPDHRPDLVCVVNPGLIVSCAELEIEGFAVPLHARSDGGERLAGQWVDAPASGSTAAVDGTVYPIAKVLTSGTVATCVLEPGRALLLFAVRMLSALGDRGQLGTAWWNEYLEGTTSEVVKIDPPTVPDRS